MSTEQKVVSQPEVPQKPTGLRGFLNKLIHPTISVEKVEKVSNALKTAENFGIVPPRPAEKIEPQQKPTS